MLVPSQEKCSKMYVDVTDKFKEDSMTCAGGADRDACQVSELDSMIEYNYLKFVDSNYSVIRTKYITFLSFIEFLIGRFWWST